MPTPPPKDPSLIHDAQFLAELDRGEGVSGTKVDAVAQRRTRYSDAFDALESGLPMESAAPAPVPPPRHEPAPRHEPTPRKEWHQVPAAKRVAPEARVPMMTAAVVIVGCLAVGGATAALVFHNRLLQITASWAASR